MTNNLSPALIVRTLGRGKKGSRDLTREEAYFIMNSILERSITGPQLGAFLMLMRVKEETAIELAGMVSACEDSISYESNASIDVNWPACVTNPLGKKSSLSFFEFK